MIVFTLTMPSVGSWNNRWSGEGKLYARIMKNSQVPKELIGKRFFHRWEDGWTACVSVEKVDCREAKKIQRKSDGFCGYDWMIKSIIKYGEIKYRRNWE